MLCAFMCNIRGFCILTLTCYVRLWLAGAPWPRPRDRTPPWRWTRRCHRWKRLRWLRGARSIWDVQVNVIRITGHNLRPKRRWHRHIAHVSYVAHFAHYRTRLEADENARGILEVANLLENIMITAYYNDITDSYNISSRNLPTSKTLTCHVMSISVFQIRILPHRWKWLRVVWAAFELSKLQLRQFPNRSFRRRWRSAGTARITSPRSAQQSFGSENHRSVSL